MAPSRRPPLALLVALACATFASPAQATVTGGVRASDLDTGTIEQPPSAGAHRFPVAGPFTWPGPGGRFGAGRAGHIHQGFDLLARDGTPVVAARGGTVTAVAYQSTAGYYVVIDGAGERFDYAYMHFQKGSVRVRVGQRVATGARIGSVGRSGDASGSHLHFEVWDGPWQAGGRPVDPLPMLRRWLAAT
jgi:murein DD-endopeptidase MepM/ murein hydrolase activator NlpD